MPHQQQIDAKVDKLHEQFPLQSKDTIKTILLAHKGNSHNTIESLKAMNDPNYQPKIESTSTSPDSSSFDAPTADNRFSYLGAVRAQHVVGPTSMETGTPHTNNKSPPRSTSRSISQSRSINRQQRNMDAIDIKKLHDEFPQQSENTIETILLAYSGNTLNAREALKAMNDPEYHPKISLDAVKAAEPELARSKYIAPQYDSRFSYSGALAAHQHVGRQSLEPSSQGQYSNITGAGDNGFLANIVEKVRTSSRSRSRSRSRANERSSSNDKETSDRSTSRSRFSKLLRPHREEAEEIDDTRGRQ